MIPTHGRPRALQACLEGLARQSIDPGRPLEVVVVDDGSPRPVRPVAPEGLELRVLRQERAGPGAARNAGVRIARGDIVVFTDDDCVPDRDWLAGLLAALDAPEAMCAGAVVSGRGVGLCAEASQQLITHLSAHHNRDHDDARFVTSNNLASTRRLFERLGGFDAARMPLAAAEDRELCERARRHGATVRFVPDAVVVHDNPLSLGGFLQLHVRYGRGARLLQVARPGPRRRLLAEHPRFYVGLVRHPFRANGAARALALSCLLVLSQAAHAIGYAVEVVAPTSPRSPSDA